MGLVIYFGGYLLVAMLVGFFWQELNEIADETLYDLEDMVTIIFFGTVFWPLTLPIFLLGAVVFGFYGLGRKLRKGK